LWCGWLRLQSWL